MSVENPVNSKEEPIEKKEVITNSSDSMVVRWKKISTAHAPSPRARHGHRAIPINDLMVVLGGGNDGIINETHIFNIVTKQWAVPSYRGDVPPYAAAFGIVTLGTRVITFGGMVEYGRYVNDLYELQATRWEWRKLRPRGYDGDLLPSPRLGHSFAACQQTQKCYLFGGLANESLEPKRNIPRYLNDLYVIDMSIPANQLQWVKPDVIGVPPSPRESHSAVIYEKNSRRTMLVYGGMNGSRLGDVWRLDLDSFTWSMIEPLGIPPEPRSLHSASLIGEKMYIYGGWVPKCMEDNMNPTGQTEWICSSTLACYDLSRDKWLDIRKYCETDEAPSARAGHSAAVFGTRLYIWSGRGGYRRTFNDQVCCSDIWYLETSLPERVGRVQLARASFNSLETHWPRVTCADMYLLQISQSVDKPEPEKTGEQAQGDGQAMKVLRGQPFVRVVKPNNNAKPATKTIIISKEDGVTQKVLYISNELNDGDAAKAAQQSSSMISTQGTTYTAPSSNQQKTMDEGGLPQNLFEESGTEEGTEADKPKEDVQMGSTEKMESNTNEKERDEVSTKPTDASSTSTTMPESESAAQARTDESSELTPPVQTEGANESSTQGETKAGAEPSGQPVTEAPPESTAQASAPDSAVQSKPEAGNESMSGDSAQSNIGNDLKSAEQEASQPAPEEAIKAEQETENEQTSTAEKEAAEPKTNGEVKKEEPESNSESSEVKKEEGETSHDDQKVEDKTMWFDVALTKEPRVSVSHYFLSNTHEPLESTFEEYFPHGINAASDSIAPYLKTNLKPGTGYRFRVAGVNGLGKGEWSEWTGFKTCLPGFPSAPSSIKITKGVDGAQLTWEPPGNAAVSGRITEYSVYLAVKNSNGSTDTQLAFMRVYVGSEAACIVSHSNLATAYVDQTNKPAIIFRIAAKNEKGYGPATQVRWLQDNKPPVAGSRYSFPVGSTLSQQQSTPQAPPAQHHAPPVQSHQTPQPQDHQQYGHYQNPQYSAAPYQQNQQSPIIKRARME